jgi:drug/metabolite transporter (DMT)-like permease
MKIAIESIQPFCMAGIRFLSAGMILFIIAKLSGAKNPNKKELLGSAVVGALLLLGGNGGIAWAEQYIATGVASLIVALVPLMIVLQNWLLFKGKRPNKYIFFGILLGFLGIVVLILKTSNIVQEGSYNLIGMGVAIFATISWAFGSVYSKHAVLPQSPLMSTATQMLSGGVLFVIASFLTGQWRSLLVTTISFKSIAAMGYLILFGSIFAYTAYVWLLKNAEPSWVSTYTYVNPVVAVLLGWMFAGEKFSMWYLLAAVIILIAVIIITKNKDK